ncbi:uncharacterized protein [Rutidosis leptorrhynchoides]|uniref:uncharacterized protein n=1 Tax=Rutidosis leptorrhynchoides TaxID=125765 RepID=UPI003A999224
MTDEYNALIKNSTWKLLPRPSDTNIVRSMWLYKHKYNADDDLSRNPYMAFNKPRAFGFSALQVILRGSAFTKADGHDTAYLLLYVDDIVLIVSSTGLLQTPVELGDKLTSHDPPVKDSTQYRSLSSALLELLNLVFNYKHLLPTHWLLTLTLIGQVAQLLDDLPQATIFFLCNNLLSWSSKRKLSPSRSSTEAEYRGVANAVAETY